MLPDRVSNPGPLTYESGALPIALRGPAQLISASIKHKYAILLVSFCCILLLPCSIIYHFSTALNDGIFNCVRRVGVMPTSMRRN